MENNIEKNVGLQKVRRDQMDMAAHTDEVKMQAAVWIDGVMGLDQSEIEERYKTAKNIGGINSGGNGLTQRSEVSELEIFNTALRRIVLKSLRRELTARQRAHKRSFK